MSLGLRNEFRIDNESSSGTKRDLKGHGAGMWHGENGSGTWSNTRRSQCSRSWQKGSTWQTGKHTMAVGVQGEKEGLKAHICFPLVWLTRPPNRFPNSLTPNRCPPGSHQDNAEGSQEPGRVKPKKGDGDQRSKQSGLSHLHYSPRGNLGQDHFPLNFSSCLYQIRTALSFN